MTAFLEKYILKGQKLQTGIKTWDVTGATATFEQGATQKAKVTAGRVIALGVLSLAVKKDSSKVYVTVDFPDGRSLLIEAPVKRERQAREFASAINQAAQANP